MVSILWARHGENVANLTRTFSFRVFDGDLTDAGRRQADELAGRLAHCDGSPPGYLACSPLRRAKQTAQIVAARLGLPTATELDDLRELNVGALDGRSDAKAWAAYNQVLAAWKAGQVQVRFPGGEDFGELCTRLRRALAAVAGSSSGGRSLIVAHGANLRAAVPGLTGGHYPGADLPTGAMAELVVDPWHRPHPTVQLLSWPGPVPGGPGPGPPPVSGAGQV